MIIIRNRLKYALTMSEAKMICMQKLIKVGSTDGMPPLSKPTRTWVKDGTVRTTSLLHELLPMDPSLRLRSAVPLDHDHGRD